GDEQLDGLAYLDAQCLCDVLLAVLARVQEVGQCFSVRDAEESRPAEYGHECADDIAFRRLVPVDRVEDGGCGDAAARGPDEGPPASVGRKPELDVVVAAELGEAVDGCRGPVRMLDAVARVPIAYEAEQMDGFRVPSDLGTWFE